MSYILSIVKADYLQRTRSYAFLITLAITIYVAYLFVPPHHAIYSTLSASGFKGAYNSAWIGYVSALMTTVMLSFYGFLLVNNGIKKDIDTEVGLIIATTPISNFKYLLSKQLSNYLVLCTIVVCTFLVSLVMFYVRGAGYSLIWSDFILPYLFFAFPALFVVASLAVVSEVFLGKRSVLQFVAYFFLCGIVMSQIATKGNDIPTGFNDPFGLSLVTSSVKNHINTTYHQDIKQLSFGFIFSPQKPFKIFIWNGIDWTGIFIFSRLVWMTFALGLVYLSSFFFHRFDFKQVVSKKKKLVKQTQENHQSFISSGGINISSLPPVVSNYSISPFIKTELLLMVRQGNKWIWLLNACLWMAMFLVPYPIAYSYLLPVLLFLQVKRWSDLTTKEKTNRLHYFTYASYRPLLRMLPAQILAGIILAIVLALPLIVRSAILLNILPVLNIMNGTILIVLLATTLGIVSGSSKLYEILFFLLTYCVLNRLPVTDYLGSMQHGNEHTLTFSILGINIILAVTGFLVRSYQTRHQ